MGIRMLTPWNNLPAGFSGAGRSTEEEDWLVSIGFAVRQDKEDLDIPTEEESQPELETKPIGQTA